MLALARGEGLALDQASDPSDQWLRLHKLVTSAYTAQQEVIWHIIRRKYVAYEGRMTLQGQLACYVTLVMQSARLECESDGARAVAKGA